MKLFNRIFVSCCFFLLSAFARTQSPMMVVLLMVKNEHEVIVPTLKTLVSHKHKNDLAYVLYDTGSTDGTEHLAKDFFETNGISNYLIEKDTFVDFATSRNRALAVARKAYPKSTFILFPDAEWYVHNLDELITFCWEEREKYKRGVNPPPYYRIRMARSESYLSLTPRLFLTQSPVEFEGVVHECPTEISELNGPESVYFEIGFSKFGADKSLNRWHRDRELLFNDLLKNPDNARTALYLGLTEYWLGNLENAYLTLKKRISMSSFEQEEYYALYNLAEVTDHLSVEHPERYTWEEALRFYMQAYGMRPHRAEPLVRIADHYLNVKSYALAYLFAKRACELELPSIEQEVLPILIHDYTYERWEILSRAAWFMQDYELGELATKIAIEADPNQPHLYNTLSYYWERTAESGAA